METRKPGNSEARKLGDSETMKLFFALCLFTFYRQKFSNLRALLSIIFTNSASLGRVGHKVAMSRCVWYCTIGCSFFLGLSLALRSHDQFEASHWSSLPPSFGSLETWKLGNSETRKLGNSETWKPPYPKKLNKN